MEWRRDEYSGDETSSGGVYGVAIRGSRKDAKIAKENKKLTGGAEGLGGREIGGGVPASAQGFHQVYAGGHAAS